MSALTGILAVDKPTGLTSHDVVNHVRRLSGVRRVGHAGTLDPLATGVLLLCIGRAARLIEYLVGHDKTYETTVRLGQGTTTYDAEGEIVAERPFAHLTTPDIEAALNQFRGPIQQTPPLYSAIKQDGQPLYKRARQGQSLDVPPRAVTVYALELLDWQPPFLRLGLVCSSGFYVRALAHDLGAALGCGGYVAALRRTAVGSFTISEATPLDAITPATLPAILQAPERAVAHLPRLQLSQSDVDRLLIGQRLARQTDHPRHSLVSLYDPAGAFCGILRAEEDYWQPHKMFLANEA
jgi:tRNA pseudouridine55 synthase